MNEQADTSTFRALHRLVEHYTPDGTLGRALLGGTAVLLAPLLFLGGSTVLLGGAFLPVLVFGLVSFVLSVPALLAGVMTLWPVYLSLIGNVDSPAAYPDGTSRPDESRESAQAVLKRRYAAGELTREQFERRLDAVMEPGEADRGDARTADGTGRHSRRERARNR